MKHVVITGVSSGIGHDAALALARAGFHVFGSVRREADAIPLRETLGQAFTPLLFDVTDADAITRAATLVREQLGDATGLAGLVNNAGCAINGPLMHLPLDKVAQMFDVNVFGVQRVTQAFLPLLGARKSCPHPPGRIVNISSVAGRLAFPFFAAYAATKHALEALSDGYRRELLLYNIPVIVIQPGTIRTPIWDKREPESPYRATDYAKLYQGLLDSTEDIKRWGLPVEAVSRAICRAMLDAKPRTRYAVIPNGLKGRIRQWWIPRLLSDAQLDRRIRKAWGLPPG